MKTATRRAEPVAVASSPATPAQRLQAHSGLVAAKEKLNRLDSERAAVQAKLDQSRAAMHDSENIAGKILAGESIVPEDAVDTEFEAAKLKGYELAIARQRSEVEKQLRAASVEICDDEAEAHRHRALEVIASVQILSLTVDEMEHHVADLRNAGVITDNRFGICSQVRLRTLILGLQPIVSEFKAFVNQ
jgi:hypothetical protein